MREILLPVAAEVIFISKRNISKRRVLGRNRRSKFIAEGEKLSGNVRELNKTPKMPQNVYFYRSRRFFISKSGTFRILQDFVTVVKSQGCRMFWKNVGSVWILPRDPRNPPKSIFFGNIAVFDVFNSTGRNSRPDVA